MVEFKFIEYGTDFGMRDMGQKLREKLLPLMFPDTYFTFPVKQLSK